MTPTKPQQDVIQFLASYRATHPYAPTFREIARGLGVALSTIRQRVRALESKGLLEHDEGVCRSIRTKERNGI